MVYMTQVLPKGTFSFDEWVTGHIECICPY
jgi:hypothetical protein